MDLLTLFMSICMHTTLACDQVEVFYGDLGEGPLTRFASAGMLPSTLGRASLYSTGRQTIEINKGMETWPEWQVRNVMMHEIAHLVAWQEHPGKRLLSHGSEFRNACYKIANAINVPTKRCRGGH